MSHARPTLMQVVVKTTITHSVTYVVMGLLASSLLDYRRFFAESSLSVLMRPIDDRWVMAGPLFQPVRGIMFGIAFYMLREPFFEKKNGWQVMWLVLVVVGIIGTFGPAPGSLEGLLYTVLPPWVHLWGLPEVLLQSLFLSLILHHWMNNPQKTWIRWVMGLAFAILMALPLIGLLVGRAQ